MKMEIIQKKLWIYIIINLDKIININKKISNNQKLKDKKIYSEKILFKLTEITYKKSRKIIKN